MFGEAPAAPPTAHLQPVQRRRPDGGRPARPSAGGTGQPAGRRDHDLLGQPGQREAEPAPQVSTRGGHRGRRRHGALRWAPLRRTGRPRRPAARRARPGPARSVGDQRQVERDRRPRRRRGTGPAARPRRSSAPPPARRRRPQWTAAPTRASAAAHRRAACAARSRWAPGRPAPPAATARRAAAAPGRRGSRRPTSATCARSPSASDAARSRVAPWSRSTRPPIGRSSPAASVHGPAACTLTGPAYPSAASVSASRSRSQQITGAAQVHARARGAIRHRPAYSSTGRSTSSPALRPIMSAPGPAAGQLGQVRQVGQLAEDELDRLDDVGARAASRPRSRRRPATRTRRTTGR